MSNRKPSKVDFSDENVAELIRLSDELGDTLIESGHGFMVDCLAVVRLAAERRDHDEFRKAVLGYELLGGAGSLSDVMIENPQLNDKFLGQFASLIDHVKKMGIWDSRLNRIRNTWI